MTKDVWSPYPEYGRIIYHIRQRDLELIISTNLGMHSMSGLEGSAWEFGPWLLHKALSGVGVSLCVCVCVCVALYVRFLGYRVCAPSERPLIFGNNHAFLL